MLEMISLYGIWAGETLGIELALPENRKKGRPISVSAVPFGVGIETWRSCRLPGKHVSCFDWSAWMYGKISSLQSWW